MTSAFGVGDEVDEQHVAIGAIRRPLAELVAPEPERPPGAQFVRRQADNVRALSGSATNSKSCNQISSNGSSVGVTRRPLLEKRVLDAVDQAALVAEGEFEDLGRL